MFFPIRYADDFVILVSGTREAAEAEKAALAVHLQRTTGLELSPDKTKITELRKGFEFLGHRVRLKWHRCFGYRPHIEIPKTKTADLRYKVKQLTGQSTLQGSLDQLFQKLNPILRGWANFYRHCIGAKRVFSSLDWYTSDRVWRWRHRKCPKMRRGDVAKARRPSRRRPGWRVWQTPSQELYIMSWTAVTRYRRGWMRTPAFAMVSGEPDA